MIAASDLFVEALDAFSSQSGSSLSFTDGALTAVARRRMDGQFLTFDNKFRRGSGL
jgi:predicted nucleic acid-binding protein